MHSKTVGVLCTKTPHPLAYHVNTKGKFGIFGNPSPHITQFLSFMSECVNFSSKDLFYTTWFKRHNTDETSGFTCISGYPKMQVTLCIPLKMLQKATALIMILLYDTVNVVYLYCSVAANYLFLVGSQIMSIHAGCFKGNKSLYRGKYRYQIWVTFRK